MNGVITRTNEAQGKSCCDIVKVDSSDKVASYLLNKLTEGDYVIFTVKDGVEGKTIEISLNTAALSGAVASPNDKVKAHSSDPNAAGYLYDKLTTNPSGTIIVKKNGTNSLVYFDIELDVTELNDVVSSGLGNGGILVYDNAYSKWVCVYAIEGTFSGTATKVPLSSAIKTLLQALYITDATDCGSSGDALLETVKDIPLGSCSFVEKTGVDASYDESGYPVLADVFAAEPTWDTLGNYGRGKGNSLLLVSNDGEGVEEYTVAIANISIDEDIRMAKDSAINVDVLFECAATGEGNPIANVKCQPVLFDGTTLIASLPYLPEAVVKPVEFPITDGVVRKVTYEIEFGNDIPDAKWFYGVLVFTCDASADAKGVTIIGLRTRYATKTIGLRIADVN